MKLYNLLLKENNQGKRISYILSELDNIYEDSCVHPKSVTYGTSLFSRAYESFPDECSEIPQNHADNSERFINELKYLLMKKYYIR